MHDVALIPGAARNACGMWPLQTLSDASLHPIDYHRGFTKAHHSCGSTPLLARYGRRIFTAVRALDRPVDLYAWSMGACAACETVRIADLEAPGLVRKLVMINPGVFGGPPPYAFHWSPLYIQQLGYRYFTRNRETQKAVAKIKQHIPDYEYRRDESPQAMNESGNGIMYLPDGFDRNRLCMFYSTGDKIVPPDISAYVAARAGIMPYILKRRTHNVPTLDTSGRVLAKIRRLNP